MRWDLQEGVDVSHSWDEVGDEGLQAVLQLDGLSAVAAGTQGADRHIRPHLCCNNNLPADSNLTSILTPSG